jgi:hypothetical protein
MGQKAAKEAKRKTNRGNGGNRATKGNEGNEGGTILRGSAEKRENKPRTTGEKREKQGAVGHGLTR